MEVALLPGTIANGFRLKHAVDKTGGRDETTLPIRHSWEKLLLDPKDGTSPFWALSRCTLRNADDVSGDDHLTSSLPQSSSGADDPLSSLLVDTLAPGTSQGGSPSSGDVLLGDAHVMDAVGVGVRRTFCEEEVWSSTMMVTGRMQAVKVLQDVLYHAHTLQNCFISITLLTRGIHS